MWFKHCPCEARNVHLSLPTQLLLKDTRRSANARTLLGRVQHKCSKYLRRTLIIKNRVARSSKFLSSKLQTISPCLRYASVPSNLSSHISPIRTILLCHRVQRPQHQCHHHRTPAAVGCNLALQDLNSSADIG